MNKTLTIEQKCDYLYMPNQRVKVVVEGAQYTGNICGMHTSYGGLTVMGTGWIVKVDQPIPGYSFDCITIPSVFIEPLEGM